MREVFDMNIYGVFCAPVLYEKLNYRNLKGSEFLRPGMNEYFSEIRNLKSDCETKLDFIL